VSKPDFITDEQWALLCKARRSRAANGGFCRSCSPRCEERLICPHSPEWAAQARIERELHDKEGGWRDLSTLRGDARPERKNAAEVIESTPIPNPQPTPSPTITLPMLQEADCPHCQARTVHVVDGEKRACLQCVADGGSCCSLKPWNRWA
jgi:hypothetical protein